MYLKSMLLHDFSLNAASLERVRTGVPGFKRKAYVRPSLRYVSVKVVPDKGTFTTLCSWFWKFADPRIMFGDGCSSWKNRSGIDRQTCRADVTAWVWCVERHSVLNSHPCGRVSNHDIMTDQTAIVVLTFILRRYYAHFPVITAILALRNRIAVERGDQKIFPGGTVHVAGELRSPSFDCTHNRFFSRYPRFIPVIYRPESK